MTVLEFIASAIGSIAWPTATIVLVILLREPVKRLLLAVTKLKYKDLEVDFGRELKELERKAKAINLPPAKPREPLVLEAPDSQATLSEAARLLEEFPEPAVALAWSAVEDALMAAVKRLGVSPDYPPHNSALKNADLLLNSNKISIDTLDLIKRMKNLRNMAVHAYPGSRVSPDEAREFVALARSLVEKLYDLTG